MSEKRMKYQKKSEFVPFSDRRKKRLTDSVESVDNTIIHFV